MSWNIGKICISLFIWFYKWYMFFKNRTDNKKIIQKSRKSYLNSDLRWAICVIDFLQLCMHWNDQDCFSQSTLPPIAFLTAVHALKWSGLLLTINPSYDCFSYSCACIEMIRIASHNQPSLFISKLVTKYLQGYYY